ncbi:MAG: hypothetical protein PWQ67_849 [Clostridia bacterium]|nr:hypothetical protein [Clostridia bacterium]MDN5322395.1 hypothetical protein [Clostridia bacterium]
MKKITMKICIITMLMFGFLSLGLGITPAKAAVPWLNADLYLNNYNNSQSTTPSIPNEPTQAPAQETTTTVDWTSLYNNWYNSRYKNQPSTPSTPSEPTTPTEPTSPEPQEPQPAPEPAPSPEPTPELQNSTQDYAGMTAEEKQLVDLINQERIQRGKKPLQIDPELSKWARIKSQDMVDNNYFAHESPTYGNVSEMLRNAGLNFRYAGENLGKTSSVTNAHRGFMNSSVHRATLLNGNFTHVGIGIVYKGSTMYVTEIFVAR